MYCKTKHLFGFEGEERDAALFVGSLPHLSFSSFFLIVILFLGSLPWSFISVISRAGGEVANLQNGSCKKKELKANRTSVSFFCFPTFICPSISLCSASVYHYGLIAQTVHDDSLCLMSKVMYPCHIHYLQDIKPSLFTCISNS